jgi:hypothetical protein
MSRPGRTLITPAQLRLAHIYVSAFVAPSLVFFAGTGALQTFRLPDRAAAPPLVEKLARLHKDDVFAPKPVRRPAAAGKPARRAQPPRPAPKPATTLLKWFFVVTSIGMVMTTGFGLWMGLRASRRRTWVWTALIAGAALPVILVLLA